MKRQNKSFMTAHAPEVPMVLLVGNYLPDGQESMIRFADLVRTELLARERRVELIQPGAVFGRWRSGTSGLGKWLGYIDKFLLFPQVLRRRVKALPKNSIVQICDHSNAMYVKPAASVGHPVLVVCHDLGAVRGALGEDTDCPASRMGRVLQSWIARSLGMADLIACVSTATLRDVQRLIRQPDGSRPPTRLVFNGLNARFAPLESAEARKRLALVPRLDPDAPFVLNVGSSLPRKNRDGILRIFARIKDRWPEGRLVFAGEALPEPTRELAQRLGIMERVVEIIKPSADVLTALYSRAFAFLFPSRFEGFGWPVIEAQACGCPVLSSDAGALKEVVGEGGFVCAADDEAAFANELWRIINDPSARSRWVEAGFENAKRFGTDAMIDEYICIHEELVAGVAPVLAVAS